MELLALRSQGDRQASAAKVVVQFVRALAVGNRQDAARLTAPGFSFLGLHVAVEDLDVLERFVDDGDTPRESWTFSLSDVEALGSENVKQALSGLCDSDTVVAQTLNVVRASGTQKLSLGFIVSGSGKYRNLITCVVPLDDFVELVRKAPSEP